MDSQRGARLLAMIWPNIDLALSEENRPTRLQFISDLLRMLGRNGVDLTDVLGIDEDIRACASHLGTLPRQRTRRRGFDVDLSGMNDPVEYELIGGPYDGSAIRLAADLMEMPPGMITLAAHDQPARIDQDTCYRLKCFTERDSNGEPSGEYLAYEHSPVVAK